jgi:5-methyltetrahydropteroyltriglutamate--homocysteine methyltransferase
MLFNEVNVDGYFLEYDTERAGDFKPLRHLPKGKIAVLGIMSSKSNQLESADDLKLRLRDAERHAPLDRLAISPQCGFASSTGGRPMSEGEQERKLTRLVEVARDVWR